MKTILCGVLLMTSLCSIPVFSQDSKPSGQLAVTSNDPTAIVYVDSAEAGPVPLRNFPLGEGVHVICVVASGAGRWNVPARCESVAVREGESVELFLPLPYQVRITSEPFGAEVTIGDSVVGQTPFLYSSSLPEGSVTLSKEGYEALTLFFTASNRELYGLLKPKQTQADMPIIYLNQEKSNAILPIVLSASSAVVSGAAAAYLKIHADNLYDEYRSTGNPTNLERVRQLDIASGIALGVCQLSLAALSYLLLTR